MRKHNIFIDEFGTSDIKNYKYSPIFTVIGLVISENSRGNFNTDFKELKKIHFGSKDYIIHNSEIIRHLGTQEKIKKFSTDLKKFLNKYIFFVLYVSTDKEKAFRLGWDKVTLLNRTYRILLGNLIKFLIAKNLQGQIISEASNVEQDITIYKNMFHYCTNGLNRLDISPKEIKSHLTSISFVTKLNNDSEEQVADLYASCPRILSNLKNNKTKKEDLNDVQKVLIASLEKKLFIGNAVKKQKIKLYKEINPNVELP